MSDFGAVQHAAMRQMLAQVDYVSVGVILKHPGVRLPDLPAYKDEEGLVLHIGYGLPVPIRDLVIDHKGIYGTLTFDRVPHFCVVPWPAVFILATPDYALRFFSTSDPVEAPKKPGLRLVEK